MTREEHKQAVTQLMGMIASEHQAEASTLLTSLSDGFEQVFTTSENHANDVTKLTKDCEELRKANLKLFLRVGETEKEVHGKAEEPESKPEAKPLPFSDLFNEKGELI